MVKQKKRFRRHQQVQVLQPDLFVSRNTNVGTVLGYNGPYVVVKFPFQSVLINEVECYPELALCLEPKRKQNRKQEDSVESISIR